MSDTNDLNVVGTGGAVSAGAEDDDRHLLHPHRVHTNSEREGQGNHALELAAARAAHTEDATGGGGYGIAVLQPPEPSEADEDLSETTGIGFVVLKELTHDGGAAGDEDVQDAAPFGLAVLTDGSEDRGPGTGDVGSRREYAPIILGPSASVETAEGGSSE